MMKKKSKLVSSNLLSLNQEAFFKYSIKITKTDEGLVPSTHETYRIYIKEKESITV